MAASAWDSLSGANVLIWIGIALCITQSAILSGLNLAIFSISKLRLEVEVAGGNRDASVLLDLRKDSNLTLATVLWGNVTINVLLTLLSDSVLAGVGAFIFSTVIITLFGEIIPQAYSSRNAIRMAALLAPLLRVYQVGLWIGRRGSWRSNPGRAAAGFAVIRPTASPAFLQSEDSFRQRRGLPCVAALKGPRCHSD